MVFLIQIYNENTNYEMIKSHKYISNFQLYAFKTGKLVNFLNVATNKHDGVMEKSITFYRKSYYFTKFNFLIFSYT
jgi:hypothetical protein